MYAPETEFEARKKLLAVIESKVGTPVCAQTDPEEFFPEKGEFSGHAKALCQTCPVIAECRDFAVWHFQDFGIWGGTSMLERVAIRRRLGIVRRPGERLSLEEFVGHWQSPDSIHQLPESLPECSEVDEQPHQSGFQELPAEEQ